MPNFTKARSTESDSHDSEARERGSVEAVVEGEKLEASLHSVGADHEVGENTSGPGIALRLTLYIQGSRCRLMAVTLTSIRLDTPLADEAAKILGVKSRTEAVHVALREIVALKRFKDLMKKHAGKLSFAAHGE